MKLRALLQVRWEQKDSHSAEVQGQTAAGDHVSESHLLLADRHPTHLPIGPASANEGITNRKSVPPGHEKDDLSLVSCQNSWVFFFKGWLPMSDEVFFHRAEFVAMGRGGRVSMLAFNLKFRLEVARWGFQTRSSFS